MTYSGIEAVIDHAIDIGLSPRPLRIVTDHPRAGPFQDLAGELSGQSGPGKRGDRKGLAQQGAAMIRLTAESSAASP
jgi:hypothetical protein